MFILGSAWAGSAGLPIVGILFITLAVASFLSVGPITWSYPTAFLTGTAAAAGIGLINSLGNLGGFVAPLMRTGINQAVPTESGVWGIVSLGVFAFLAAGMLFATKFFSAKADALLEKGLAEVDDAKRLALFQDAVRLVIKDGAFIPIHQQVTTWAARKGIDYEPRTDERTYAHNFKPQ